MNETANAGYEAWLGRPALADSAMAGHVAEWTSAVIADENDG